MINPAIVDEAYSYASLIADLIDAMNIRADCQWLIGDKLQGIEVRYADRTMQQIADDIGASAASLYNWKDLSAFYTPTIRQHYRELGLSFSHFREAYKLGSIDAAYGFLDVCVALKYTTTQAAIEVRKARGQTITPAPVYQGPATFYSDGVRMVVTGMLEGMERIEAGVRYEILIRRAL